MKYVLTLILFSIFSGQSIGKELSSFKAIYKIGIPNITVAEMIVTVKREDNKFLYKSEVEPKGIGHILNLRAHSYSKIIKKGEHWLPLVYEKEVADRSKKQSYRFDWKNYKARILYKSDLYTLNISKGTIDENTFQLKLREDIINARNSDFDENYTLLSDGRLKERRFVKRGKETIETTSGRLSTIRIERYKNKTPDQIYWLSPEHNYLPLKMIKLDGDKIKTALILKSWTLDI